MSSRRKARRRREAASSERLPGDAAPADGAPGPDAPPADRRPTPVAPAADGRRRRELWVLLAWVVVAAEVGLFLYLGQRAGGVAPVKAYVLGPVVIVLAAFVVALLGIGTALLRRPFATRPRVVALSALAVVVATVGYPIPFPSRHEGHPSRVDFELPVRGVWAVVHGGETATNLLARSRPDRRFGLDLLVVDPKTNEPFRTDGRAPEDHLAFGAEVLAPAPGRVVRVVDRFADQSPRERTEPGDDLGNHVVLEVGEGEYLFLGGLRRGSVAVAEGDEVRRGDRLAEVGSSYASGVTPWPHLAVHLQDTPELLWGQGIPIRWVGCETTTGLAVRSPRGGSAPPGSGFAWGQRIRRRAAPDREDR